MARKINVDASLVRNIAATESMIETLRETKEIDPKNRRESVAGMKKILKNLKLIRAHNLVTIEGFSQVQAGEIIGCSGQRVGAMLKEYEKEFSHAAAT